MEEQPKRCGEAEDTATSIVHAFIFGAYFSSVLGAIVSDSFLGKNTLLVHYERGIYRTREGRREERRKGRGMCVGCVWGVCVFT